MSANSDCLILAGDVGGTKTRLGLFAPANPSPILLKKETFLSATAAGVEEHIVRFLAIEPPRKVLACLGIAGPVQDGECIATNLAWRVSEKHLRRYFGWEQVRLVNDLTAMAYAIPILDASDIHELHQGRPDPTGNMGLIAPGTGLGMALLFRMEGSLYPCASEGGHVDFAPRNEKEISLLRYLMSRMEHVSVERVASGPGIFTIYSWLRETRGDPEPTWLRNLLGSGDPAQAISAVALAGLDPVCEDTVELFVSLVAAAAGNLALTGLTKAGMYIGGGIFPRIMPKLSSERFLEAFAGKGRFQKLLTDIPVRIILNEDAPLLGAAQCATRSLL